MKISPFCIFDSDFHFEISNNDKNLCGTGIGSPSLQKIRRSTECNKYIKWNVKCNLLFLFNRNLIKTFNSTAR